MKIITVIKVNMVAAKQYLNMMLLLIFTKKIKMKINILISIISNNYKFNSSNKLIIDKILSINSNINNNTNMVNKTSTNKCNNNINNN